MTYKSAYQKKSTGTSRGPVYGTIIAVLIFVALFGGSVYYFRKSAAKNAGANDPAVATDDSTTGASTALQSLPTQTVPLNDVEKGTSTGQATRDAANGKFHITLTATLPAIDRTTVSYEGWLVSKYPFNYMPLGELVTDQTGAFVIDWTDPNVEDLSTYTWLVITRQNKTDDAVPGSHVVEGNF